MKRLRKKLRWIIQQYGPGPWIEFLKEARHHIQYDGSVLQVFVEFIRHAHKHACRNSRVDELFNRKTVKYWVTGILFTACCVAALTLSNRAQAAGESTPPPAKKTVVIPAPVKRPVTERIRVVPVVGLLEC